jgi:hypothetical protein
VELLEHRLDRLVGAGAVAEHDGECAAHEGSSSSIPEELIAGVGGPRGR